MPKLIRINKAHYPVTVLGPGRRIGIWMQGCSIGCKGCVSQDTWAADPKMNIALDNLLNWCFQVGAGALDGVTISGGEPFDQPRALTAFLDGLDQWRKKRVAAGGGDFDLLCYSGYPLATLQKRFPQILARLDAVIPEPYVEALPQGSIWCGSGNQRLIALSARGKAVYSPWIEAPPPEKQIQVTVEKGRIFMIGIPARDDMEKLEELCAARGLKLDAVSWRR